MATNQDMNNSIFPLQSSDQLLSPFRGINLPVTPLIKEGVNCLNINSPFSNNIFSSKSPLEWASFPQQGRQMEESPLNNFNKISPYPNAIASSGLIHGIYIQKDLVSGFSPYSPKIVFSSSKNKEDSKNSLNGKQNSFLNFNGKKLLEQFELIDKNSINSSGFKINPNLSIFNENDKEEIDEEEEEEEEDKENEEEEIENEEMINSEEEEEGYDNSDILLINNKHFNKIQKLLKRTKKRKEISKMLISKLSKNLKKSIITDHFLSHNQFLLNSLNFNFNNIEYDLFNKKSNYNTYNEFTDTQQNNNRLISKITNKQYKGIISINNNNKENIAYCNNKKINLKENKFNNEEDDDISVQKCKCKNSKCLKLYCECFANGRTCKNCLCEGCHNTEENAANISKLYEEIVLKNPKAIQKIKSIKKSWTCKCKHSNCQKKYCDCYQNGKCCSSKCKCVDCKNKNINGLSSRNPRQKLKRLIRSNKTITRKYVKRKDEVPIDAMYTPSKKSYRINNNKNSTAAYTELSLSIDKNLYKKTNKKKIFKKLNMDTHINDKIFANNDNNKWEN